MKKVITLKFTTLFLILVFLFGAFAKKLRVPKYSELNREFERRMLLAIDTLPMQGGYKNWSLGADIAHEVFAKYPSVLRQHVKSQIEKLDVISESQWEGFQEKASLMNLGSLIEAMMNSQSDEEKNAFYLIGRNPLTLVNYTIQVLQGRNSSPNEMGTRAVYLQLVPAKTYQVANKKGYFIAVKSLRDYFIIELKIADQGYAVPVSIKWLTPNK